MRIALALALALADAEARAIKQHDLIRIFNERGSVICAADVSALMAGGVCKAYESCANLDLIDHPTLGRVDRAGALNLLTPPRVQVKGTSGMATNSCLIEIEKWTDSAAFGLAAE